MNKIISRLHIHNVNGIPTPNQTPESQRNYFLTSASSDSCQHYHVVKRETHQRHFSANTVIPLLNMVPGKSPRQKKITCEVKLHEKSSNKAKRGNFRSKGMRDNGSNISSALHRTKGNQVVWIYYTIASKTISSSAQDAEETVWQTPLKPTGYLASGPPALPSTDACIFPVTSTRTNRR
ncbi:hypothetical protein PoB_003011900 [Plakobranchus ocellatus]|uniref:Uncharacterized protein n=1 Tax=Plakobranchus ocellatus TaxID=259542 RepID=A0AAV4ABI6_9GAST|nr:hypothetical protein PoB_003011900 [Plakobranchus ocellatus]